MPFRSPYPSGCSFILPDSSVYLNDPAENRAGNKPKVYNLKRVPGFLQWNKGAVTEEKKRVNGSVNVELDALVKPFKETLFGV